MKKLFFLLAFVLFATPVLTQASRAAGDTPFVAHISTDDPKRISKAVAFSRMQFERGHPVTVYLDDKGVFLATKESGNLFPEQQKTLIEMMGNGVSVIVCPYSMKLHGVSQSDIMADVTIGTPEMADDFLFDDRAKSLSW